METFQGHSAPHRPLRKPVVAIGNFDGVHRGHAHIFEEARRLAARGEGEAVVLTFDPHPAKVLAPQFAPPLITPLARKLELFSERGIDVAIVEPFDHALAALSPEAFVSQVLASSLSARHVVVGYDFTFGRKRSGNTQTLGDLGARFGFGLTVVPPVSVDEIVCSSTKVREFVLEGRVDGARLLLGRPPEVEGTVVRGAGRGRTIGVATANLALETELLPRRGVYAGTALVDGRRVAAAINVGTNPTFTSGREIIVEAHLLDFDGDLYDKKIRLAFAARLRDEERFAGKDALVEQIRRDVAATRAIISQGDYPNG